MKLCVPTLFLLINTVLTKVDGVQGQKSLENFYIICSFEKIPGGRDNKWACKQYWVKFCIDQQKSCIGLYICGCDFHASYRL